ncbi:protein YY1-like [Lolium rigidum]|uniref:protein YY1-like n=1 Tax=Lolium rigidum TaxID=89674 RepID=UPI001F5DCAA3|nr:protein YY1-like [Lolium rigidum]
MAVSTAQLQPRALAALWVLLALLLLLGTRAAEAQQQQGTCGQQLTGLAPCARYSVPPALGQALPVPGPECCSALGSVSRDCACGAIDIINSLPAKCGLPRVTCRKNHPTRTLSCSFMRCFSLRVR